MSARGEITGVQYLRGLAAVAVVIDHTAGTIGQDKYFGGFLLGRILESGRIGADLFFLISGFIITIVSLKGADLAPAVGYRTFFERRLTRILPLMWLAVLANMAARAAGPGLGDLSAYLHAWFLLPWGIVRPPVIWTLRQELIFYLFFAVAMLGPRKLRIVLLLWMCAPLLRPFYGPEIRGSLREFLFILCHGSAVEFGAGMLLGWIWLARSRDLTIRLPFEPLAALTLAFCLPLGVTAISQVGFGVWAAPGMMAVACLPVMFLGIHAACPDGWGKRVGSLLGNASYSIYLFHSLVVSALAGLAFKLARDLPPGPIVAVIVVVAVLAGIAIHMLIEKPLIAGVRHLFERRVKPGVSEG